MESINLFNGLNGSTVSREILLSHIALAKRQEQYHVADKLERILLENSDKEFTFEIERPAMEIVPGSLLKCLDCEPYKEQESFGLAKPVSPNEIYDRITEMVIGMLDQDYDFEEMWGSDQNGYVYAYNFISKKPYRGINQFLLGSKKTFDPKAPLLQNPYFLTFEQIKEKKGILRKGSKGQMVIYYVHLYSYEQHEPKLQFSSYDKDKFTKWVNANKGRINALKGQFAISVNSLVQQSLIPILKYYNVFSGSDIDGIDFDLENFPGKGKIVAIDENNHHKIEIAELIIENYPNPKPKMAFGGDNAFFRPSQDLVQMPNVSQFKFIQAYYTIFFHELVHSTATPERLDRVTGKKFGDKEYAFEELTAELGAMFLCGEAGILHYTKRNSAAYLKNWRTALLQELKNDNKFFFRASSQAQKAVDYMLDRDENGIAAYEKFISAVQPKSEIIEPKKEKKKTKKPVKSEVKEIERPKPEYGRKRKYAPKPKVDKNGQYALLGVIEQPETIVEVPTGVDAEVAIVEENNVDPVQSKVTVIDQKIDKNSIAYRLANKRNVVREYYDISDPEIAEFLGKIEKKTKESVAITITGGQGSMKTRFCFQLINAFAQNYKVGHASIEEHPESGLYEDKVHQYLNPKAQANLVAPEIENIQAVHNLVRNSDIVIIDSFSKLQEMQRGIELDKDFRKAYDGKLFIIIYQMTGDGKMRGGSKSQFDGDAIAFVEKMPDYKNNYIYWDKNRYQDKNLEDLKFNIFSKKLIRKEPEKIEPEAEAKSITTTKFSFQT